MIPVHVPPSERTIVVRVPAHWLCSLGHQHPSLAFAERCEDKTKRHCEHRDRMTARIRSIYALVRDWLGGMDLRDAAKKHGENSANARRYVQDSVLIMLEDDRRRAGTEDNQAHNEVSALFDVHGRLYSLRVGYEEIDASWWLEQIAERERRFDENRVARECEVTR